MAWLNFLMRKYGHWILNLSFGQNLSKRDLKQFIVGLDTTLSGREFQSLMTHWLNGILSNLKVVPAFEQLGFVSCLLDIAHWGWRICHSQWNQSQSWFCSISIMLRYLQQYTKGGNCRRAVTGFNLSALSESHSLLVVMEWGKRGWRGESGMRVSGMRKTNGAGQELKIPDGAARQVGPFPCLMQCRFRTLATNA